MKSTKRIENHKAKVHKGEHFSNDQICDLHEKAEGQEKALARFFFNHPNKRFSPTELHDKCGFINWPKTSTRRGLTNLKDDDILVKTDYTVEGEFGRPEHQWRWKWPEGIPTSEPEQLAMFGGAPSVSHAYNENLR